MTPCKKAREQIKQGAANTVREHLETCPSCAEFAAAYPLFDADDAPPIDANDLASTFKAVQAQIGNQFPVRRRLAEQRSAVRIMIVVGCALAALLVIFLCTRRADWSVYPALRWLTEAGGMFAVTAALLLATIRSHHLPALSPWKRVAIVVGAGIVLAAPLLLPLAHQAHSPSLKGIGDEVANRAAKCFFWGIAVSIAVGLPAHLVTRGARGLRTLRPRHLVAMGIFAELALHLHCPIVHPLHIGLGHVAIVPALLLCMLVAAPLLPERRSK